MCKIVDSNILDMLMCLYVFIFIYMFMCIVFVWYSPMSIDVTGMHMYLVTCYLL